MRQSPSGPSTVTGSGAAWRAPDWIRAIGRRTIEIVLRHTMKLFRVLLPLASLLVGCGDEFSSGPGGGTSTGGATTTGVGGEAAGGGATGAAGGIGGAAGEGGAAGGTPTGVGGGGAGDPCTAPGHVGSVSDNFSDGTLEPWVLAYGTAPTVFAGQLQFTVAPEDEGSGVYVPETLDLTGCSLSVRLGLPPAGMSHVVMRLVFGPDPDNCVTFGVRASGVYVEALSGGAVSHTSSAEVVLAAGASIRMREEAGELHFETRQSGDTWTEPLDAMATPSFVSEGEIELAAAPDSTGTVIGHILVAFDDVNRP